MPFDISRVGPIVTEQAESKGSTSSRATQFLHASSFRTALWVFLLTRAIILGILLLRPIIVPVRAIDGVNTLKVTAPRGGFLPALADTVSGADAVYYLGIAISGYEHIPFEANRVHNWAFFPLYPLALRAGSLVTSNLALWGVLISNAAFFLALLLLHKLTLEFGFTDVIAERAIFYLGTFPGTHFFSVPLSESLFLVLVISAFYAARRDYWWLGGILGGLASVTRPQGVVLFPALALEFWLRSRPRRFRSDTLGCY